MFVKKWQSIVTLSLSISLSLNMIGIDLMFETQWVSWELARGYDKQHDIFSVVKCKFQYSLGIPKCRPSKIGYWLEFRLLQVRWWWWWLWWWWLWWCNYWKTFQPVLYRITVQKFRYILTIYVSPLDAILLLHLPIIEEGLMFLS